MEKKLKIGVLGAESTGKTSLCEALSEHFGCALVPEYAREYFKIHRHKPVHSTSLADIEAICAAQHDLELQLHSSPDHKLLLCDTTVITCRIWAILDHQRSTTLIDSLCARNPCDNYLITSNDLAWQSDDLRLNRHPRELIREMNIREVERLGKKWFAVKGQGEESTRNAIRIIEALL